MGKSLLEQAKEKRDLVLWAELGGWLHDLGKLSAAFIRSKTDRAYVTSGEEGPPEESDEWRHGDVLKYDAQEIPDGLKEFLEKKLLFPEGWREASIADMIANHHKRRSKKWLVRLLQRADGEDSGEDEYNAVGLHQREPVQAATVFGREEPLAGGDLGALDEARRALYANLGSLLKQFEKDPAGMRAGVWNCIQRALRQGLGKTQRAANDVRLDQHVWGVASRLKAFLLRDLLDPPEGREWPRPTFRLLTVRWDGWGTVTPFDRLSDVVGRAVMLEGLRERLRHLIEAEYGLGNRVYEDDDGVHFLVADLEWGEDLVRRVRGMADEVTGGEVRPVVRLSGSTWRVTDLVNLIRADDHQQRDQQTSSTWRVTDLVNLMKAARRELPIVGRPAWVKEWEETSSGEVCPVCRKRPLEGGQNLCSFCEEWRKKGIEKRRGRAGTVWTGEIADGSGRVALVVARFDLRPWLDGTMLHTLFITSPQDIATVPADPEKARKAIPVPVQNWLELQQAIQRLPPRFLEPVDSREQIKGRQDTVRNWGKQRRDRPEGALARWLTHQFGRLRQILETARGMEGTAWPEDVSSNSPSMTSSPPGETARGMEGTAWPEDIVDRFLLALARKNPSASRLLRVWQTTGAFLEAQAQSLRESVEERKRAVFTLEGKPRPGLYTARVPVLGQVEVFVRPDGGKVQTVTGLTDAQVKRLQKVAPGQEVRLLAQGGRRAVERAYKVTGVEVEAYHPYQVITVSPNLLLAMVPAGVAMDVIERLQAGYAAEFGKVQGRLPFHVGLIFMDAHYPMFAALDSARRLVETFDRAGERWIEATVETVEEAGDGYDLHLSNDRFGGWTWHISSLRGDGETDWYHPYLLVAEGEGVEEREMSLVGPYGRWVHISQVQAGDRIRFRPNLFTYLFLDTVSRRLEAHAEPRYLLERADRLREVWEAICRVEGMSETRLEGAATLLARKRKEWKEDAETYRWLVDRVVARDLGGEALLREAVLDGAFFDAVEVYRHVLKRKIGE